MTDIVLGQVPGQMEKKESKEGGWGSALWYLEGRSGDGNSAAETQSADPRSHLFPTRHLQTNLSQMFAQAEPLMPDNGKPDLAQLSFFKPSVGQQTRAL